MKKLFSIFQSKNQILKTCTFLLGFLFLFNTVSAQFVHPGLSHKKSDLERIKYMIEAKIDPWYSSYQHMCELSTAQYTYTVQGDISITDYGVDRGWKDPYFDDDARCAYYGALRWYIEEDERYAEKAIEAIMAWTGLTNHPGMSLKTAPIWLMIEAAELIKNTYDGWAPEDIKKFEDMLVYPGYSSTTVPSGNKTWYWNAYMFDEARAGNQELCGIRTVAAIGIFLDNEKIYDRAMRYVSNLPAREDDLPYARGPRINHDVGDSTEHNISFSDYENTEDSANWGYCGVLPYNIFPNGQNVESSRDQGHTNFSLGLLCTLGEIGWNQGYDFFGLLDSRVLTGLEYSLRYSVSYLQAYEDQPEPWEATTYVDLEELPEPGTPDASADFIQIVNRTARDKGLSINPDSREGFPNINSWELPIAHYVGRGLKDDNDLKWTIRARDYARQVNGHYEPAATGQDYTGYGALLYTRPTGCMGDPIIGFADTVPVYDMNVVPCTIEAEHFDYNPIDAEGRIYHDADSQNSGGKYRLKQSVDIDTCSDGGYQLISLEDGEWLVYTVAVRQAGYYNIDVRYAATSADGKIKLAFDGEELTNEITLPFGDDKSNGIDDFSNHTVATKVLLQQGVQAMKVMISGTSNSYVLDNISITKDSTAIHTEAEDYTAMSGVLIEDLTDIDGLSQVESIDAGDWMEYDVNLPFTQNYTLDYRLASATAGTYTVTLDGSTIETFTYTATGADNIWQTQTSNTSFPLHAGVHTLRITAIDAGSKLNWIDLVKDENTCSLTEILPYFTISNPGGIVLDTLQTDEVFVVPTYNVELSSSPMAGGTWSWTGPNGFTSSDRILNFDNINVSQGGEYIIEFTNDCGTMSTDTITINVSDSIFIEAEHYTSMSGVEISNDASLQYVTSIDDTDFMEYTVYIPYTGNYLFNCNISSTLTGAFSLSIDGVDTQNITFDATGDDNTWATTSTPLATILEEGEHTLQITASTSGFNIDWLQFTLQDLVIPCQLPFVVDSMVFSNETSQWSSGVIDISCADSVNLFMNIDEVATVTSSDYLNIYYKIDGNTEFTLYENTGTLSDNKLSATGIHGSTIEIIVNSSTSDPTNAYTISDLRIAIPPVFDRIEAEDFYTMFGIQSQETSDSDGNENIGWVHNGDWLMYKNIDLTGAQSFNVRYSSTSEGNAVEMRIGSPEGTLLSTLELANTGNWNRWSTATSNITPVDGIYDVYMVLVGGDGYLFNVNWFQMSTVYIPNTSAAISSSIYTVNESSKTIENVPNDITLATFVSNLLPDEGASFEVYEADATTLASNIGDNYKVIVTAENGTTKAIYTVTLQSQSSIATTQLSNKIFPNPLEDYLTVINSAGAEMKLYNSMGSLVYKANIASDNYNVDLHNFNTGLYIIKLNENNTISRMTILKK